jgi:endonuclease/exonuclease/phosphatase family metal-dependent hydrolase
MKTDTAPTTLTVATYNIHRCIGTDGRKDPGRIAAMLRALGCDIVGLQEVESHGPRGGDAHQLDYLARHGGYESVPGPTMRQPQGHYGNALLTRARVVDVSRHVFARSRWEPRGALETRLEIHGRPVRAIVTHLGLNPSERRNQVAKIIDLVGAAAESPTVLLGDFNEWFPWARSRRRLRRRFGRIPTPATFPSRWPLFALDHVYAEPESALVTLEPVRTPLSRVASDHLPLRASISLAASGYPASLDNASGS